MVSGLAPVDRRHHELLPAPKGLLGGALDEERIERGCPRAGLSASVVEVSADGDPTRGGRRDPSFGGNVNQHRPGVTARVRLHDQLPEGREPVGVALVRGVRPRLDAVALLWPPGFSAKDNPLRVYNAQGAEVAAEGDTVTAGGVFADKWSTACQTQGYFEVLEIKRGAQQPSFAP